MSFVERESLPTQPLTPASPPSRPRYPSARLPGLRRRFWRSLRWRLSLWYVGLLTLILLALGAILLIQGSRLLYQAAYESFTQDAHATALTRLTEFHNAIKTTCPMPVADTFQATIAQPLAQESSRWQAVALLDPRTSAVVAPLDHSGGVPAQLAPGDMQTLLQRATGGKALTARDWKSNVTHAYTIATNGLPGGAYLISTTYAAYSQCPTSVATVVNGKTTITTTPGKYVTVPAVLLLTRDFTSTQTTVRSFVTLLIISVMALFILGLAIGVPVTNASLTMLSRVTLAAQKLAQGDLRQRVGVRATNDEIGDLARAFDDMAARVENAFRAQQESEQRVRQFVADASHELRTPLTSIRGYLDVLARAHGNPAETDHILRSARREAERMTRLVNDLLTLTRFDTGPQLTLAWTDMWELAGEAVDQARLLAGARAVMLQGDGDGRLLALVDADRIKQVLLVLLDNALKYGRQDAGGWVRLALSRTPESIIIQVSDNGPGIAAAEQVYIFQRFYRARQQEQANGNGGALTAEYDLAHEGAPPVGSGLGLAIAQAIVRAHHGAITVASELGQGTIFTLRLPLTGP